jgi:hypothetical protein
MVQQIKGQWIITAGKAGLFSYPKKDKALADQVVAIIKKYGFTYICYILDSPGGDKVPFSLHLRK